MRAKEIERLKCLISLESRPRICDVQSAQNQAQSGRCHAENTRHSPPREHGHNERKSVGETDCGNRQNEDYGKLHLNAGDGIGIEYLNNSNQREYGPVETA